MGTHDYPPLILASRSPRRRQLLDEAGYTFEVLPPESADESPRQPGEPPAQYVMRLAEQKATDVQRLLASPAAALLTPHGGEAAVHSRLPTPDSRLLLSCDTVAHCDGEILGKPDDAEHARRMLQTLSGREHEVLTGVCLVRVANGRRMTRVEETRLRMDALSEAAINEYVASGQWEGKAGGFGFQDRLGWIHIVEGSASNVVGLPLELLAQMIGEITNDE